MPNRQSEIVNGVKDVLSTGLIVEGSLSIAVGIHQKDTVKVVSGVVELGAALVTKLSKDKTD